MSITITCQFQHPYQAQQAAERLRRRGFTVSQRRDPVPHTQGNLLVAYPYGTAGVPGGQNPVKPQGHCPCAT